MERDKRHMKKKIMNNAYFFPMSFSKISHTLNFCQNSNCGTYDVR